MQPVCLCPVTSRQHCPPERTLPELPPGMGCSFSQGSVFRAVCVRAVGLDSASLLA